MKSFSRVGVVSAFAVVVGACSGGSSPDATTSSGTSGSAGDDAGGAGTSSGGTSGTSGASSSGTSGTGSSGTSGTSSGASSSGTSGTSSSGTSGTSSSGSGDAGSGDSATGPTPPSLSLLAVNQSGRSGEDIRLALQGSDVNQTAFGVHIKLADSSGTPIAAFKNWDGTTFAERTVLFDDASAAGLATFARTVTLAGFFRDFPHIAKITTAIVDATGSSAEMTTTLTAQTIQNLAQSCDPAVIANRCALGLSCDAGTSVCVHPTPPQIALFQYVTSTAGGRMLFSGNDPADDLSQMHLEFMDASGHSVLVDITGNNDYVSSFDLPITGASSLGSFFYAVQSIASFDQTVLQLAATPSGASGTGTRTTAMLSAPTVAASGGACDPRGFALCASGEFCVKSGGASTCVANATALASATSAAPMLDVSGSAALTTGYTTATNLWGDPPADCVPTGVHGMPATIVMMHLAHAMATLTLTTDHEETNARAALYVLTGTGASVGTTPIGCNSGYPARLTLTNLGAGDYTVVVGATSATGGHFGVSTQ